MRPRPHAQRPKVRGGSDYKGWTGLQIQPYSDGIHTTYRVNIVGPLSLAEQQWLVEHTDAKPRIRRQLERLKAFETLDDPFIRKHVRRIRELHNGRLKRFRAAAEAFDVHEWVYVLSEDERQRRTSLARALDQTKEDDEALAEVDRLLSTMEARAERVAHYKVREGQALGGRQTGSDKRDKARIDHAKIKRRAEGVLEVNPHIDSYYRLAELLHDEGYGSVQYLRKDVLPKLLPELKTKR